jgi:hypothetical protein
MNRPHIVPTATAVPIHSIRTRWPRRAAGDEYAGLEQERVDQDDDNAASRSNCGEEACGLFGELFRKLEVRAMPGVRVEDQPGVG